jgi:hypothetical protein
MENEELQTNAAKFAIRISLLTSILTIITFAIAILTPPLSGPFCKAGCFQYPFIDMMSRFPRDYFWMYFAMVLMMFYLAMIITVHQTVANNRKHFSLLGVAFGIMATLILMTDYFIQVSVIQPSLLAGETEGISILSQFNPHGIFIVLEEIGFMFMIISFFCLSPTFSKRNSTQKAIKWTSVLGLVLTIISLIVISIGFGIKREYRFEVAVISIAWLELIILGFLYFNYFKKLTLVSNEKM